MWASLPIMLPATTAKVLNLYDAKTHLSTLVEQASAGSEFVIAKAGRPMAKLVPITGITLPFLSAGGSSLIISFAAVGILLSISRETVQKGTWNTDADPDRGRRDGRTHLPGTRRGKVASRTPGRP